MLIINYQHLIFMTQILDSTLREGEQTPNVYFTMSQKIKIAKLLDKFGVDFIEIGHPAISKLMFKDCQKLNSLKLKAEKIAHSRAKENDILKVKESGCPWIGIFMGINEYSLKYKFKLTKAQALKKIYNSVKYAKKLKLKVRYTIEDSARTKKSDFLLACRAAIDAGVDRISISDTVGAFTPYDIYCFVKWLKSKIKKRINIHCHNDLGLAVANSLAAYQAGADLIDVTVNGLGERCGITDLASITSILYFLKKEKNDWHFKILPKLCQTVSKFSRLPIPAQAPIIGDYAFTHKAGLHINAVLKNPQTFEIIPPADLGISRKILIGQMSGINLIKKILEKKGLPEKKILEKLKKSKKDFLDIREILKEKK